MKKYDEMQTPNSCLNKAKIDEQLFVLLARDECAPGAIRYWCQLRLEHGLNTIEDRQIQEALKCAEIMRHQQQTIDFKS